jgi:methionyl-tRNA synthetase
MGKDNVTFHTVIFNSRLLGNENKYRLVHHLIATEFLNYENKKFSKYINSRSFGDQAKNTGMPSEVWRYYLLEVRPEQADTDFKWIYIMFKNNNELLSNLGNFLNQVLKFTGNNFNLKTLVFKKTDNLFTQKDKEFLEQTKKLVSEYIN